MSDYSFPTCIETHPVMVFTAFKEYTYNYNLTKKTELLYDLQGENPIETIEEYAYDTQTNLIKNLDVWGSSQEKISTIYQYPIDQPTGLGISMQTYNSMIDKNSVVSVYSMQGTLVTSLAVNKSKQVTWNYTNSKNQKVSDGMYIIQLDSGSRKITQSFVLKR